VKERISPLENSKFTNLCILWFTC